MDAASKDLVQPPLLGIPWSSGKADRCQFLEVAWGRGCCWTRLPARSVVSCTKNREKARRAAEWRQLRIKCGPTFFRQQNTAKVLEAFGCRTRSSGSKGEGSLGSGRSVLSCGRSRCAEERLCRVSPVPAWCSPSQASSSSALGTCESWLATR